MKDYQAICSVSALPLSGIVSLVAMPEPTASPMLVAMQQELSCSMDDLKKQPMPPYFLSYEITETHSVSVRGAYGTITSSNENQVRLLDIDLRVGNTPERFDEDSCVWSQILAHSSS